MKFLSQEKDTVYKIYMLALLQGILYLAIPLTIQGIITYTMAGKFTASLLLLSLITILATVFIGTLQLWQMRLNETLQENIFCRLCDRMNSHLASMSSGSLKNKIAHFFEVVTVQKGIGKILLDFSFSIISIVFGLLILPAYNTWFLAFSLMLGMGFYMVVTFYGKKALEANILTSDQKYKLFNSLSDLSKKDSQESPEQPEKLLDQYLDNRKDFYRTFEKQYKGILIFKVVFISILLLLGAYLVQIGQMNIGQFVASEIIILLVINSVEKLVFSLGTFYDLITGLYKIESFFSDQPENSFLLSGQPHSLSYRARVYNYHYSRKIKALFYSLVGSFAIVLFLPWTQSVSMNGEVGVIDPKNEPQQITTRIAGRVEKWYIRDGQMVHKDDTIAFISEIKEEYMDTMLVARSESQVKSKETAMKSYESKINAIDEQIDALNASLRLKANQIRNKIGQVKAKFASDSAEAVAAANNYKIAEEQFKRYDELLQKGVISKTDHENRKIKLQESLAKKVSADNKVIATRNELFTTEIELNAIQQEYNEKLMKAESEKFSTISLFYDAEGSLTKLQNQLTNYSLRNKYYYVLAPQDGYVHNITVKGVGEIVKEGGILCKIVPVQTEQAVELFVDPIDLPLISIGEKVQLVFDGWPAFVFSGWPGMSYGTYTAKIVSYDKVISSNGKFRVLAVNESEHWPENIQIGSGVEGFALLRNVPLVYEIWRKANGFPPEYYKKDVENAEEKEKKK